MTLLKIELLAIGAANNGMYILKKFFQSGVRCIETGGQMRVGFTNKKKSPWVADYQVVAVEAGQKISKRVRRYFRTKSEAKDCCDEMTRKYLADLEKPIISTSTIQSVAQMYLDHHFVRKSPNYKSNEAQRLEYWLAVLGPARSPMSIEVTEIENVLSTLLAAGRAHSTVAHYRAIFGSFWKFCLKRKFVDFDIMTDVMEIKKRPKRIIRALTDDQCNQLMAHMGLAAKRCILLFLHLGLRAGELFGDETKGRRPMCVEDVDWDKDAVLVFSNEQEGETKGHAERWLPLDDVTRTIFREAGSGPVVGDAEYWWFRDQMEKAAQRSGLGHATIHQLRHTFCSMNLANGVPEAVVSSWLGHKDSSITKRYTHLNEVLNEEYRDKITIGEMGLAPVPRFSTPSETTTPDFLMEIRGLQKNDLRSQRDSNPRSLP